jgi:rhodanese-related sulfurtransferase
MGITLGSCSQTAGPSQEMEHLVMARTITSQELQELMDSREIQLVDVRTKEETKDGMIQDAILLDFTSPEFKANIEKLDKSKPVVFYCAVGFRSEKASSQVQKLGFTEIYDLQGGLTAWKSLGHSLVYPDK